MDTAFKNRLPEDFPKPKKSLLDQLDSLSSELEDISALMEKTEVFRSFNRWLQEKHTGADVVCEINRYDELLSIDSLGTVIRADSLLQIRYSDTHGNKRSARKVEPESPGDTDGNNR